jgi:hyperpolarization activated cyclic nucleotide-gated potassium channel 1
MIEETDRTKIAKEYLSCWFWIDLISILPIDEMMINNVNVQAEKKTNVNQLVRMAKLSKLTKVIRLFRLVKVVKIFKNSERITTHFSKSLEIKQGTNRMIISGIVFIFTIHIFACAWVFLGQF